MKPSRRRVLRVVRLLAQRWYPTWMLRRETGLSQRAIQQLIQDLADVGFRIERRKDGHTPEYYLVGLRGEASA